MQPGICKYIKLIQLLYFIFFSKYIENYSHLFLLFLTFFLILINILKISSMFSHTKYWILLSLPNIIWIVTTSTQPKNNFNLTQLSLVWHDYDFATHTQPTTHHPNSTSITWTWAFRLLEWKLWNHKIHMEKPARSNRELELNVTIFLPK